MARINLEEIRQMMKEGDFDEAQSSLAQMLIDNPKDEAAWLLLADILPPDQAQESLERVLEINPDNNEALLRLAHLIAPQPEYTPVDEEIPVVEVPENHAPGKAMEDMNLEELIRSLEEKEEMLPAMEPVLSEGQPGETPASEDSFLADLLQENPPALETMGMEEQVPIEEGSFFLANEEESPAESLAETVPADEGSGAIGEAEAPETETLAVEMPAEEEPQQAPQEFLIGEEAPAPEENKGKKKRKKARRAGQTVPIIVTVVILLCILVSGLSSWYYFYGPCGVENVVAADQALNGILTRWDESMMVATNSSRVVLAEPLRRLVDIRSEVNNLEMPVCMAPARDSLDRSMLYTIEAYDNLFKYENDAEISKRFNMAKTQRVYFEMQMDYIRQCAPLFCQ